MSNERDNTAPRQPGRLAEAMREVKTAMADRDDVVVEMREATRMRLELLAQELAPVFAEVPVDDTQFDFVISQGLQPRLWIDHVAHVAMGRDRRTYVFARDTRLGRTVLGESTDIKPIAERVTRYVAERLVERQRFLDGTPVALSPTKESGAQPSGDGRPVASARPAEEVADTPPAAFSPASSSAFQPAALAEAPVSEAPRASSFLSGLGVVIFGAAAGVAIVAAIYWEKLAAYLQQP